MSKFIKEMPQRLMNKLMISCDKASYLISKSQDEKLSCKEKLDMHMHLAGCKFCRFYKKDIDIMSRNLREFKQKIDEEPYQLKLSTEEKERIKAKLDNINER
jgi:hypothetical protein